MFTLYEELHTYVFNWVEIIRIQFLLIKYNLLYLPYGSRSFILDTSLLGRHLYSLFAVY